MKQRLRPDPCQLTWFEEMLLLRSAPAGIKSAVLSSFGALGMLGTSANAAGVDLDDIFSSSSTTTSHVFNDGSNNVTIGTSYESGNLVGVSASLVQFTCPAIGVTEAANNDITITFDKPVNLTISFSGLAVNEEFWAFDATQSSLTLATGHLLVTSGTGSISGYTMIRGDGSATNAAVTVVSWSGITSLNLRNGRRGGTSTFAQDISLFDVTVATQYGWDYGLTKRCVQSINPAAINYYEDKTDGCTDYSWLISVSSQKNFQNNPQPSGQAFPINEPDSPMGLTWADLQGGGKQVTLTTDFINHTHPADEPGYFVFYQFGDHKNHGGTQVWPKPTDLRLRFNARYREVLPRGADYGRTRWMAIMLAFWTDTNGNLKSRMIEVMPYITEDWKNAGGAIDPAKGIINYVPSETREYIAVMGEVFGYATKSTDGSQSQSYDIDWGRVIDYLTATPVISTHSQTPGQTYLTPPSPTSATSVSAVTLATETHVRGDRTNSALCELTIDGFRVDSGAVGTRKMDLEIRKLEDGIGIGFNTALHRFYTIRDSEDLVRWNNVETNIPGDGSRQNRIYSLGEFTRRFFKVLETEAP